MDLLSRNPSFSHVPAPTDPGAWEKYILSQQGSICAHSSRTIRRFTVDGIPTLDDFKDRWEERHARSSGVNLSPPIIEHESRSSSCEPCVFDISDLNDNLPGDGLSSRSSSHKQKYHHTLPRNSSFNSARFSPYNSPKRNRRFGANDFPQQQQQQHSVASSFEDSIRRDKARFSAQQKTHQHHGRRGRPRPSALPKREQFGDVPQEPFKPFDTPNLRTATTMYHQWHEECGIVFQDKSTMTNLPLPPTPACQRCQQVALLGGSEVPDACAHSLEALFRSATNGPASNPADSTAYFKILKEERNRWHTDRFGQCKEEFKEEFAKKAHVLFVHINELYVKEKSRQDSMQASREAKRDPDSSRNYFDDVEHVKVW